LVTRHIKIPRKNNEAARILENNLVYIDVEFVGLLCFIALFTVILTIEEIRAIIDVNKWR
jgi:hypothetical protein